MRKLTIYFWDVQHGHAVYINTPNNRHFVIDLGIGSYIGPHGQDQTFSPLKYIKNVLGVNKLDGVIITHPHADHLDDIFNLNLFPPDVLTRPYHLTEEAIRKGNQYKEKKIIDAYLDINSRYIGGVPDDTNPYNSINNGDVSFKKFHPMSCADSNLNNHSIVSVLSYLGVKIIIPGDNESCSWNELLEIPDFIKSICGKGVLLASHHGRESGFCDKIFEYFTPYVTVISDTSHSGTSCTDKYYQKSEGWNVRNSKNATNKRYCLTTRSDGYVKVEIGNPSEPYLQITTEA